MLRASFLLSGAVLTSAWMAISPVTKGSIDMFNLGNDGAKQNDVLSFPVAAGETVAGGALACGRCFCFVLTNNAALKASYLYNISFCLVPKPVVNSKLALPGLAYNLHTQTGLEPGPGAGEDGFTVLIDHTVSPQRFLVTRITGNKFKTVVDISKFVDAEKSNVLPGGTAYCADTATLWVAVSAPSAAASTLVTVDITAGAVTSNISYTNPILAAHFADCKQQRVGGLTLQMNGAATAVVAGWLSPQDGFFTAFDHANLPAGSNLQLAPIAGFFDWNAQAQSPVSGVLYTQPYALPGQLYSSVPQVDAGGVLTNLQVPVAAIAQAY